MTATANEPGRTAYKARFESFALGDRGVAPAWKQLLPVHQAIWARVEEVVLAMTRPAEQEAELWPLLYNLTEDGGWRYQPEVDLLFGLVGIPRGAVKTPAEGKAD